MTPSTNFAPRTTSTFPGQFNPFIKKSDYTKPTGGLNDYVVLKSFKEGALVIPYSKIVRVEAAKSYSMFYFADGTRFFSSHNLSYHARQLDQRYFQRIHKSHIINLNQVKEVITDKVKKVMLFDGSLIEVSRRKASSFVRMFKLMMAASF
ncbi:MAG: LytTR family DNA-binding domain-containing protein [Bacteroidota bacterium]